MKPQGLNYGSSASAGTHIQVIHQAFSKNIAAQEAAAAKVSHAARQRASHMGVIYPTYPKNIAAHEADSAKGICLQRVSGQFI